MIVKTTVKASGYNVALTPELLFYKGDVVFIEFTLFNSLIKSINGVRVEEMLPLNELSDVKLKIETPEGVDLIESTQIIENKAKFKMNISNTTGVYKFQIVCYDSDGCVCHLPPCTYSIADTIG